MNKHSFIWLFCGVAICLATSCKKGDTGPAGPKGRDGNANVIQLNYGSQTFTGVYNYPLPDSITLGMIDTSLVLAYYVISTEVPTSWYPIPGLGSGGLFETRMFTYQSTLSPSKMSLSVRLMKPDGSGSYPNAVTFTKLRVLIIPASKLVTVNGFRPDVQHYEALRNLFDLRD